MYFLCRLNEVAIRKGVEWNVLIEHIINTVKDRPWRGLEGEYVSFHDDKSTYTGFTRRAGWPILALGTATATSRWKSLQTVALTTWGAKIQPKVETNHEFLRWSVCDNVAWAPKASKCCRLSCSSSSHLRNGRRQRGTDGSPVMQRWQKWRAG